MGNSILIRARREPPVAVRRRCWSGELAPELQTESAGRRARGDGGPPLYGQGFGREAWCR